MNSRAAQFTAVIVTFNSAHCIGRCVLAARACMPEMHVVIVDNASTDGTLAAVKHLEDVAVIALRTNLGFGAAVNVGVEASSTEAVLVMNPDIEILAAHLPALTAELDESPAGILVPLIRDARRPNDGEIAAVTRERAWPRDAARLLSTPFRRQRRRRHEPGNGPGWASGALFAITKTEFFRLGGFDESFFMYWEDRELSHRYRAHGYPIRPTMNLRATHVGGGSTSFEHRPTVTGWAILGFVEYVSITRSKTEALLAALTITRGLRLQNQALRWLAATEAEGRWTRKQVELSTALDTLRAAVLAEDGTPPYCWPRARPILREVLGAARHQERQS